nr:SRPBCC family protein [Bordetella sp. N]
MEFSNSFEVSLPPEQAWPWLMNVESMVPCMPGAELVEKREDGSFQGKISVQLGPVRLAFVCDATFAQVDNAGHKAQLRASGADDKGRGTASANIGFRMQPSAKGSKVIIDTDLQLVGAVAQYGRGAGLIQNVANQIISQFARNLESRIGQLKAHAAATGEDYLSRAAASSDETVQATAPLAAPASTNTNTNRNTSTPPPLEEHAAPATSAATEDYVNGYKAGYTEGFQAGHAAGYAAALRLAGGSGPAGSQARSHGAPPPFPQAKPISGLSLFFSSLGQTIAGWFSRRRH